MVLNKPLIALALELAAKRIEGANEMTESPTAQSGPSAFRKKPVVIQASQWFKDGDHPAVKMKCDAERFVPWCQTLEGGHVVTAGDWIITGVKGEHYPCKPDIFAMTYEPATDPPSGARDAVTEDMVDAAYEAFCNYPIKMGTDDEKVMIRVAISAAIGASLTSKAGGGDADAIEATETCKCGGQIVTACVSCGDYEPKAPQPAATGAGEDSGVMAGTNRTSGGWVGQP